MGEIPKTRNTKKKQLLLKKALKLFAQNGFAAVGVRQIAEEAGVSIGLIRMHFGSKDGLRKELDRLVMQSVSDLYQGMLSHPGDNLLDHMVQDAVMFSNQDVDMLMYLRMALMENSPGAQEIAAELLKITESWISVFDEKGLLRANVDKKFAALFMTFNLVGPLMLEPFAQKMVGASMYDADVVERRNKILNQALTQGLIKS